MKKHALAVIIGLFVSAPVLADEFVPTEFKTIEGTEREKIEEHIRYSLRDPDSAKFGHIFSFITEDGSTRICAYVNARNAYGGYTGYQVFWQAPGDKGWGNMSIFCNDAFQAYLAQKE
ncbi:MAG: hypothetical protein AAF418_02985 [Pseudomonadota bacterium]